MCFWDLFSQCHRLFAGIPSLISPVRAPNIKAYSNACMYVYIYIGIISCIYRYDIIIYQMIQYQMVRPASAFNEAQRQRIAKVRMTAWQIVYNLRRKSASKHALKLEVNGLVPLESWCIDMYRLCFRMFHALCIRLLVGLDGDMMTSGLLSLLW